MSDTDSTLTSVPASGDEASSDDEAPGGEVFGDIRRGSTFASRDDFQAAVQAQADLSSTPFRVVVKTSRLGNPDAKPGKRAAHVALGCAFRADAGQPAATGCQWRVNGYCRPPLYDEWCVDRACARAEFSGL